MKVLLTACSFCGCGEHCGLVGISGMAKFVVNDVTVLSCGDGSSLARAAWGWWGYGVQYRAPPTRRRASDAPGYMQPVVVGLIQTVRESSPLTKIEKQLQLTSDVSPTTIKRASSQEPTI